MATFLAVHGAWTGGWSWRKMHEQLRGRGHVLLAPTLTGLGERAHLASPAIDLETHVADILGVVRCEDLRDLILIGHSYGGMVATVIADRIPERLRALVYLDAFVPQNGENLFDQLPPGVAERMKDDARRDGDGWRVPANPLPPDTPPADVEWMLPLREMQPIATFEQPARIGPSHARISRTYIYCKRAAPGDVFRRYLERGSKSGWHVTEIDASHSPHVTSPDELTQILDFLSGR